MTSDKEFLYNKFHYKVLELKTQQDIDEMEWDFAMSNTRYFAFDTETTGLNFMTDKPFLVIFGFDKNVYCWEASFTDATKKMYEIIQSTNKMLFAHNAKYDYHMMLNGGTPIPDNIEISDSITLMRLISSADDEHASMRLEKLGEKYVDPDSKFASDIIKGMLEKMKAERKKEVCNNYKLLTGERKTNDAWLQYHNRIRFITEYHECFDDYKEPTYYDAFKRDRKLVIDYAIDDVVILLEFLNKAGSIYANKYYDPKTNTVDTRTWKRENRLIRGIALTERNGFKVDVDYLIKSHHKISKFQDLLYDKLRSLTHDEWNVGQHAKIKEFFSRVYGINLEKSDKKAMQELEKNENQEVATIARLILKLRTVSKWLSTYIDGILNKIIEVDGEWKLYTSINNNGTVSGRVSCDLQQMPKYAINQTDDDGNDLIDESLTDDEGNELFHPRRFIIPSNGYKLYYLDYSQMELRIQAYYTILTGNLDYHLCKSYMPYDCVNSETGELFDYKNLNHIKHWGDLRQGHPDPHTMKDGMEDLFKEGWSVWIDNETKKPWVPTDLHTKTTLTAFPEFTDKTDTKEFKKKWRYLGKSTNFAKNYGCGPTTLASNLNIPFEIAKKLSDGYNESYPGVIKYQQAVQAELTRKGFVTNLYGRRYFLENSTNFYKANNYLIQGSGADMLKEVEIKICDYLKDKKSRFILPIHDEVCIEIHPDEEDEVPLVIKNMMEDVSNIIPYVPVVSDVEATSTTWADKKDVYL